jgi:hypothetical protein
MLDGPKAGKYSWLIRGGYMIALMLLMGLFTNQSFALNYNDLQIGTLVELTQDLYANKRLSGTGMQCMLSVHAVYPKVILGPTAPDVKVRYFVVVGRMTDPITYRVYLQSEQLPCGCQMHIDQAPGYLRGDGEDFKMLIQPRDLNDVASTPPVGTSCGNYPSWVAPQHGLMAL